MTIVPRDPSLLPPVIALSKLASACSDPVIEAAVESESTTFINQVENHAGQPVVLMITPGFEAADLLAARIERNLWLERDWFEPDYAGRPWTLWTANSQLRNDATNEPLRMDSRAAMTVNCEALLATARSAAGAAYAPYSNLAVGAALLFDNSTVITASNVENADYSISLCAETIAVARR